MLEWYSVEIVNVCGGGSGDGRITISSSGTDSLVPLVMLPGIWVDVEATLAHRPSKNPDHQGLYRREN